VHEENKRGKKLFAINNSRLSEKTTAHQSWLPEKRRQKYIHKANTQTV